MSFKRQVTISFWGYKSITDKCVATRPLILPVFFDTMTRGEKALVFQKQKQRNNEVVLHERSLDSSWINRLYGNWSMCLSHHVLCHNGLSNSSLSNSSLSNRSVYNVMTQNLSRNDPFQQSMSRLLVTTIILITHIMSHQLNWHETIFCLTIDSRYIDSCWHIMFTMTLP